MSISVAERAELREVVRQLVERRSSEPDVRRVMASSTGHDVELWATMAGEIGLQGLAVPEEHGGAGAGWAEVAVVMEELGRAPACVPFLATVGLALPALIAAGGEATRWLPGIADGTLVATAAVLGAPRTGPDDVPVTAERVGGQWFLSGTERYVLDGAGADLVLVPACSGDQVGLFALEGGRGLSVETVRTSDQTRRFAHLTFDHAPAAVVGAVDDGLQLVDRAREIATLLLAWEQVGGASATLDMAVAHARTRHQFGRPIGSFQAVKHLCADMLVAIETARAAAWGLLRSVQAETDDLGLVTAIARTVCSERYDFCATTNVQVHGGIAFTWEHPAHLHLKRSRGSAVLLGSALDNRELLTGLVPVLTTTKGSG
ncbi:acyl-CoA dehydrogenase family protein [Nocardioides sp. SOB44]|uniref:Acyl-CoA dehydrogenase family protein n=1 Tax=Nocardioides cremeus TaxID=3058044 RepID=A0ABT8TPN6_9ACTN|nr:acyl-CoA dehydrogenase family protein [Nocardioides cremeus]MDO3395400.1 acyl-CoA dehydrogenase family protein [Nocardioides cremeus]